jgi:hypothetical protein
MAPPADVGKIEADINFVRAAELLKHSKELAAVIRGERCEIL